MKNNVFTGLFMGLVFPFAFFLLIQGFFLLMESMGVTNGPFSYKESIRDRTVYLFSIISNILVLNFFQRRRMKEVTRGIVVLTMILAIAWVVNFGKEIM